MRQPFQRAIRSAAAPIRPLVVPGAKAVVNRAVGQQKGQMGWWATHDGSQESFQTFSEAWEQALVAASPEDYITIVDCHI